MKNVIKNIWIFLVSGWAAKRTEKATQIWAKEDRRWWYGLLFPTLVKNSSYSRTVYWADKGLWVDSDIYDIRI